MSAAPYDPAMVKAQAPALVENPELHYLDSAAMAQLPAAVIGAVSTFAERGRANVKRGLHRLAEDATEAYERARMRVARHVNAASPSEIVFTPGCTAALNFLALSLASGLSAGDEIALSELEHHSNIIPWQMAAARTGAKIRAIPVGDDGRLRLDRLDRFITDRCRIVSVSSCSNVTGAITDLKIVEAAAHAVGARLVVDAAQTAPHGQIDAPGLGVDFLAFSGHKTYGPTGIGVLWGRSELLADLPPAFGGGSMIRSASIETADYADPPHRFEAGTPPVTEAIGLAAALDWLDAIDLRAMAEHEMALTERLLRRLSAIPGVRIVGPESTQARGPVVSFVLDGVHPHDVSQILDERGVCVRAGHHCAEPLMERFGVPGTTRASIAAYNDQTDIDALAEGIEEVSRIFA